MTAVLSLRVFADYSQFYVQDESAALANELPADWSEESVARLLAVTSTLAVGVGTARPESVPVTVRVAAAAPEDDGTSDLVTEASIAVPSGRLVVAGPSDYLPDAKRLDVAPGTYGVRVFYRGLDTVHDDGLDGQDSYELVLWPCGPLPPRVVADRRG